MNAALTIQICLAIAAVLAIVGLVGAIVRLWRMDHRRQSPSQPQGGKMTSKQPFGQRFLRALLDIDQKQEALGPLPDGWYDQPVWKRALKLFVGIRR